MIKNIIKQYTFSRKIPQAARQIYLQKQKEDSAFKDLLKSDQQGSLQKIQGDNYVAEPKRGDSRVARVQESLKETNTHIIQQEKFKSAVKEFDLKDKQSKVVIKDALQQEFFLMKKFSEEQAKFEEEMKIKKRKQEFKNVFKEIEDIDLQPDNQYSEQIPYFNKLSMDEKFEKISDWNKRYTMLGKIDPYLLQRARTSQNIENFLMLNLQDDAKLYDSTGINATLSISQILTNKACTVVWVFLKFMNKLDDKENQKQITKLNRKAKFLSWKMCQELGLKYGPEIRFEISKREERIEELKRDVDQHAENIVKSDLIEKFEAGEIPRTIKKSQFNKIVAELREKKSYLHDEISNASLMTKRKSADSKNITKKETQVDKSAAEKFWDQL